MEFRNGNAGSVAVHGLKTWTWKQGFNKPGWISDGAERLRRDVGAFGASRSEMHVEKVFSQMVGLLRVVKIYWMINPY